MKQSKKEVISQNNIESTANKTKEKNKNGRDNLKLSLLKSENGSDKVDKTGGISFKALHYLEISAGNKKWETTMSEKGQNKDVRFVPLMRKCQTGQKKN